MDEKKDVSLFSMSSVEGVKLDPSDPRTWFMVHHQKEPDRIELTAQMYDHSMFIAGVPAKKFYYEAKPFVYTIAAVAAYYGLDAAQGIGDAYVTEAEAMGQKMIYSENAMPTIDSRDPLIKAPEDLLKLKPPDWINSRRVSVKLDMIKLSASMGSIRGTFCAPFSLAVGIRSYPKLIKDIRKNPTFAHDLFTRLVDEVLPSYLKVQKDYCGVTLALGADAWSCFPNLSPELIEEWVVPYSLRLLKNCQSFGLTAPTLGADYCEERLERFDKNILFKCLDSQKKLAGGMPSFFLGQGRWFEYPFEPLLEYLNSYKEKGVQTIIIAGINARLLRDGPVESIVECIKRFIDVLGRDHKLTLWLANIPADTPPEHIHAAVNATSIYGQRPIAENLSEIEFRLPKRESFQEYMKKMSGGGGLGF